MRITYITAPDMNTAKKLAKILLEKKLSGCVNIFPIESMYWWNDEIKEDKEIVLLAKSTADTFEQIKKTVRQNHPYDTPAIYSWPVDKIDEKYSQWLSLL